MTFKRHFISCLNSFIKKELLPSKNYFLIVIICVTLAIERVMTINKFYGCSSALRDPEIIGGSCRDKIKLF